MDAGIAGEARIGRVDPPRLRAGVPAVDRGVVLHAGIGAAPRGVGDLTHQLARLHGLDHTAVGTCGELPVRVVVDRPHELIRYANRVVRVLVLDRVERVAVDPHVEAGVAQGGRLLLLARLAPDEVLDVRVVDVEYD